MMSSAPTMSAALSRALWARQPAPPLAWDETSSLREEWRRCIDQLRSWLASPEDLTNDSAETPTEEILSLALHVAESMLSSGLPAPTRVVPTVSGGVAFELRSDDVLERIEIDPDAAEYMVFVGSRLVERATLAGGELVPRMPPFFVFSGF